MVEASLGDRGRVAAGNVTGLPAQAPAGRLHQCIASTTCTAVLSWAVELSESSGSSSAFKQHCVWIATVPMLYTMQPTAAPRAVPAVLCGRASLCRTATAGTPAWRSRACEYRRLRRSPITCTELSRPNWTRRSGTRVHILGDEPQSLSFAFWHVQAPVCLGVHCAEHVQAILRARVLDIALERLVGCGAVSLIKRAVSRGEADPQGLSPGCR